MAEITIINSGRNNALIIGNNVKNTDRTIKTEAGVEGSLQQQSSSTKSTPPAPNLKFGKQFFFNILKKRNLKDCFPNFNFGTEGELFLGKDRWHKLSSPSKFLWSILAAMDNRYCNGNWRLLFRWSLFWQPSGIVILASTGNCYFGSDWRSLVESFAHPHWRTVKTVVQMLSQIHFVFAKNPTKFGLR